MKTIETRYIGPTNYRGSRYVATDGDNRVIVGCNDALSNEQNHMAAAISLGLKLKWRGALQGGYTKRGMVFVFTDPQYQIKLEAL